MNNFCYTISHNTIISLRALKVIIWPWNLNMPPMDTFCLFFFEETAFVVRYLSMLQIDWQSFTLIRFWNTPVSEVDIISLHRLSHSQRHTWISFYCICNTTQIPDIMIVSFVVAIFLKQDSIIIESSFTSKQATPGELGW